MNVYDYINGLKNMSFTNTMLTNTYTDVRSGQPDMIDVCCLFVLLYDDEMMTGQSSVVWLLFKQSMFNELDSMDKKPRTRPSCDPNQSKNITGLSLA